jgi:hypothetical protein
MFCEGLAAAGYEFDVPRGAFYLFPKSPIKNDIEFAGILKQQNILVVPFFSPSIIVSPDIFFRMIHKVFIQAIIGGILIFYRHDFFVVKTVNQGLGAGQQERGMRGNDELGVALLVDPEYQV